MPDTPAVPILYTQAGCAESAKVRSWLTDQGIPFDERDASADPQAAAALAATDTFATPLLVIGDERVLGFREQALAALLDDGDASLAEHAPSVQAERLPGLRSALASSSWRPNSTGAGRSSAESDNP